MAIVHWGGVSYVIKTPLPESCNLLCYVGVKSARHVIGSHNLMQTAASRKLSRALLRAPDESAGKVLTTGAVKPDLLQYILTLCLSFCYKRDHFPSLSAPDAECC